MTEQSSNLRETFIRQGEFCEKSHSHFNNVLLKESAALLDGNDETARTIHDILKQWLHMSVQELHDAAVGLRWCAAWYNLSLRNVDEKLTTAYPGEHNGFLGDVDSLRDHIVRLLPKFRSDIHAFMQHEPQTNEVNRALIFLPGWLHVAKLFPNKQLACFELGASAGLNILWPYFQYTLTNDGSVTWGDQESPVRTKAEWRGTPITKEFASTPLKVASVHGCDRRPTDLKDESQVLRLRSYVWPDQRERVERLNAALQLVKKHGVHVDEADAAEWTESNVKLIDGQISILYHSYVWQYLPEAVQKRVEAHMTALGEQATDDKPLAWLTVEARDGETYVEGSAVTLRVWPGNKTIKIAECHPHGRWIDMKL